MKRFFSFKATASGAALSIFDEIGDAKKDMAYIKTVEGGAFKFLKTVTVG